ncbi:MAG TPA: 50S ribosomal protein L24 [Beijerinckiaceae bacterium]|nr:50S ribosomal protein L24 [Beijerinckiaceae bacterium]HLM26075.1 50S ribosomal protein L24 [Thermoleophilaceae bacterium]
MKVRRDDQVKVISGKDRGKTGRVVKVDRERERVYVEGLNIIKRHQRPRTMQEQGGIIEAPGPIHVSNVQLLDPDGQPSRVGVRRDEGGRRVRVAKRSGKDID